MKILAKQNRELIMINAQNTQNENDAEKITLQVPEQYEDFNKKIVFLTPDGNVWDIITNNEYLIKKAITKYKQVDFYIWLTKGTIDFRSQTKTLKFYYNVDVSNEITDEEIGRVNTVINLLEEEITKVENLETEIDGKLEEIDIAIDNANIAIQEVENLNLDAEKVGDTTTVTLTKKDGTVKTVHINDGVDLQFMWQGTSLGIKTEEQSEYTFVDLQGVQGQRGEQGDPFTIKKTYSSVAEMNADFNNMQLGDYVMIASTVEVADNAKLYTRGERQWIFITDFSGATGIRGETGLTPNIQIGNVTQGSSFNVTRTGTNENPVLNFTLVKGDKGNKGDKGDTGETGNGIESIIKTATVGLVDTYTITFTNGNTTTFTVTNGEVTQAQFDDLQEQVQDLQNNTLKGTGNGESIDILDGADSRVVNIGLSGNSKQETKTYKGLLKVPDELSQTINGVNITVNNDGSVTTKGTSTDNISAYIKLSKSLVLNGTFTFSLKTIGTGSTNSQQWHLREGQGTTSIFNPTVSYGRTSQITKEVDVTINYLQIFIGASKTVDCTIYPILEEGDTATDWDSAITNTSPNPDYRQEVKSAGDNGSITEDFVNKNLFDGKNLSWYRNNSDWLITDASSQRIRCEAFPILGGETYTVSNIPDGINLVSIRTYAEWNGVNILDVTRDGNTFTLGNSTKYIHILFGGEDFTDETKLLMKNANIMLEKGTTSSQAIEYQGQIYSISVQEPMRSIGDVRDGFAKVNGIWNEVHYIVRYIFTGAETINKLNSNYNVIFQVTGLGLPIKKPATSSDIIITLSNYFRGIYNANTIFGTNVIGLGVTPSGNTNIGLGIDSKITTVDEFKTMITEKYTSGNPLYIDYVLSTPTYLPCTSEQIEVLNAFEKVRTYKNITHIYSEDEVSPIVDVIYVKDLETYLNNLINS